MPIIFADPFGSFFDGFVEGKDLQLRERAQILDERRQQMDEYETFVWDPQQQLAEELRSLQRQLSGRASATSARQRRDDERTMERDRFTIRPRRTGAAPAAVPFHGSNSFRLPTDVTGAPERFRWPT